MSFPRPVSLEQTLPKLLLHDMMLLHLPSPETLCPAPASSSPAATQWHFLLSCKHSCCLV